MHFILQASHVPDINPVHFTPTCVLWQPQSIYVSWFPLPWLFFFLFFFGVSQRDVGGVLILLRPARANTMTGQATVTNAPPSPQDQGCWHGRGERPCCFWGSYFQIVGNHSWRFGTWGRRGDGHLFSVGPGSVNHSKFGVYSRLFPLLVTKEVSL